MDATASAGYLAGSRAHKPSAITERKALAVIAVEGESQRTNLSQLPVDSPREIEGKGCQKKVLFSAAKPLALLSHVLVPRLAVLPRRPRFPRVFAFCS